MHAKPAKFLYKLPPWYLVADGGRWLARMVGLYGILIGYLCDVFPLSTTSATSELTHTEAQTAAGRNVPEPLGARHGCFSVWERGFVKGFGKKSPIGVQGHGRPHIGANVVS